MVAKLAVIIIAIGAAFGVLLVNRQHRIDAVAEISRAQLRMELHEKTIMRLQAAVAQAIRPDELRVAAFSMPIEWQQIPYRFDPFRTPTGGEAVAAGAVLSPEERAQGFERPGSRSKPKGAASGSRNALPERRKTPQRVADGSGEALRNDRSSGGGR
jgi:hypothetical protein